MSKLHYPVASYGNLWLQNTNSELTNCIAHQHTFKCTLLKLPHSEVIKIIIIRQINKSGCNTDATRLLPIKPIKLIIKIIFTNLIIIIKNKCTHKKGVPSVKRTWCVILPVVTQPAKILWRLETPVAALSLWNHQLCKVRAKHFILKRQP